jgi:hypothetical protein
MRDIESLLGGLLVEDKYLERLDYEMTPLKSEAILDAHVHHHKINFGDEFGMHTPRAGEVLAAVEYVRKKARRTGQPMNAEQARHWIDANHGKFFEKEPDDETPVKKESVTEAVRPEELKAFTDQTTLLPHAIIDTVLERAAPSEMGQGDRKWFLGNSEERLVKLFNADSRWKSRLKGVRGRDFAYTLINHWLQSYLVNPRRYKQRHG